VQSCTPSPQSFEFIPPLWDSSQSFDHDTEFCPHVISMDSRLKQLKQEMKNYRKSMEKITSTLIEHCTCVV